MLGPITTIKCRYNKLGCLCRCTSSHDVTCAQVFAQAVLKDLLSDRSHTFFCNHISSSVVFYAPYCSMFLEHFRVPLNLDFHKFRFISSFMFVICYMDLHIAFLLTNVVRQRRHALSVT